MTSRHTRVTRVLVTALASLVLAGAIGWFFVEVAQQSWSSTTSAAGPRADDLLLLVVASLGAVLTVWLGCGLAAAALACLPGAVGALAESVAGRLAPAVVRRAAAVLLGTALASATAVPAFAAVHATAAQARPAASAILTASITATAGTTATPSATVVPAAGTGRPTASGSQVPVAPDPDRLPVPAPPTPTAAPTSTTPSATSPTPAAAPATSEQAGRTPYPGGSPSSGLPGAGAPLRSAQTSPSSTAAEHGQWVTVAPGDCLWHLAARRLGPAASAAQIDAEWRRWYAANRDRVGPDPDLVLAGQRLVVPASTQERATPGAAR